MNLVGMALAVSLAICAIPAAAAETAGDAESAAQQVLARFMLAWRASDAKSLAGLFATDADFVSPYGNSARGRDEVEAFYAAAFARGYAGSKGTGEVIDVRMLAPGLAALDGRWQIADARNTDGSPRADEKGILFAVIGKRGDDWQILALRENAGASDLVPMNSR